MIYTWIAEGSNVHRGEEGTSYFKYVRGRSSLEDFAEDLVHALIAAQEPLGKIHTITLRAD